MISQIAVTNYRRIINPGIQLENIAPVNYIVGENGSGKSSLINYLYESNPLDSAFIVDSLSDFNVLNKYQELDLRSKDTKKTFEELLARRYAVLDLLGYASVLEETEDEWNIIDGECLHATFEALEINRTIDVQTKWFTNDRDNIDKELLTSGDNKIINLTYIIFHLYKFSNTKTFLIEEIGNHLHPKWQKRVPKLLDFLASKLDVQFFVTTHSPFIIAASGELTECLQEDQKDYIPSQKVYFLKEGRTAGKKGNISNKGKAGYWGKKVSHIASSILGAGMMDLVSPQRAMILPDSPTLVLCEGEGRDEDSKIYNAIFEGRKPPVLFVSARGSSQLFKSFSLLQEIQPGLSADLKILMVRDRDHEYPTLSDISQFESDNYNIKVLRRRAVESYIYNSETASLVLKQFGKRLSIREKEIMEKAEHVVDKGVKSGAQGNSYKQTLIQAFNKVTRGFLVELMPESNLTQGEKIATLITPKTNIYKELHKIIFE